MPKMVPNRVTRLAFRSLMAFARLRSYSYWFGTILFAKLVFKVSQLPLISSPCSALRGVGSICSSCFQVFNWWYYYRQQTCSQLSTFYLRRACGILPVYFAMLTIFAG